MEISEFDTDLDLEKNGVWVDIGDGAQLLVARIGNPDFNRLLRSRTKPVRRLIAQGRLAQDAEEAIMIEVMADTVLLGWKGLTEKDKSIKFSRENALKLLAKKDFRKLIEEVADAQETFRAEEEEADAGNSKAS